MLIIINYFDSFVFTVDCVGPRTVSKISTCGLMICMSA